MKKFIIACTAVIIAVTCWMFVSDRIGSTLSFNMNKEVKTFTWTVLFYGIVDFAGHSIQ